MKRSRFVKEIQHFLETYSKEPGLFGRKNEQAEELVNFIEKLGMLPPAVIAGKYYSRESAGYETEIVNEWETEDEKN